MTTPNAKMAPTYLDEQSRDVLRMMEAAYDQSITIGQTFWYQANRDAEFYAGNQSAWNSLFGVAMPDVRRKNYVFNRIKPIVEGIAGHQTRNRKVSVVTPVENGDSLTADQFTKLIMWQAQQDGTYYTISDAFRGSLITGMTLLHTYMDYREDPVSGNIKTDALMYNQFLIDPFMRKLDMSDCNFVWRRSFLTKRECISLMPDQEELIMSLAASGSVNAPDAKFNFLPENANPASTNLLTYDEYYYRDYRTQLMIVDAETGETVEWRSNDKEELEFYLANNPNLRLIKQEIPTVNCAIVIQGRVAYDGPNPNGSDKYPFVPVTCYWHPELADFTNRVQGVVRGLVDAQWCYNRRKVIELDILESQLNSGFIVKEDSLINPADVYLTGQGRALWLKKNAQMSDVQRIESPAIPPTTLAVSETLANEMNFISGITPEALGMAQDDISGILGQLRMKASFNTLEGVFDQLDRAQALLTRIHMDYIQTNFTPGKVQRILGGEEPSELFYSKAFGRYNVAIEDGFLTSTQRQLQLAQMVALRNEAGINFAPEDFLEAATLQNKQRIMDNMKKRDEQAQQQAQQQQQAEQELLNAQMQDFKSRAAANQGLAVERSSRVEENIALGQERRAAAVRDEQQGLLNLVKAIKEVETMDISNLKEVFALSQMLTARRQEQELQQDAITQQKKQEAQQAVSSQMQSMV